MSSAAMPIAQTILKIVVISTKLLAGLETPSK